MACQVIKTQKLFQHNNSRELKHQIFIILAVAPVKYIELANPSPQLASRHVVQDRIDDEFMATCVNLTYSGFEGLNPVLHVRQLELLPFSAKKKYDRIV